MKDNNYNSKNQKPLYKDNIKMDISSEGTQYLISNLTNLYTHPETAVFREYTANALDSHLKAGQTKPILVNLTIGERKITYQPSYTVSQPFTLTVEDFGVGMSKEDIINNYSQYGASTKRENNTEIGAFGLGCKSALAITDVFYLTARQNGTQIDCRISKDFDGVGVVEFIKETPTDQPDGVKVIINAEKNNIDIMNFAEKFFSTWTEGTVLLNGQKPYHISTDPIYIPVKVSDEEILGWFQLETEWKPATLRYLINNINGQLNMGGIMYKIEKNDREQFRETFKNFDKILEHTVLNVPIGSIDLTPPREGIRYSPKTVKTIINTYSTFLELLKETLTYHIDNLDRKAAAICYIQNINTIFDIWGEPFNSFKEIIQWRGESFYQETNITYMNNKGKMKPLLNSKKEPIFYELVYPKTTAFQRFNCKDTVNIIDILYTDKENNSYSNFVKMVLSGEDLCENWFSRNIRDYGKFLNPNKPVCFIITNDDINSNAWLDAIAPTISKEELIEGARAYRRTKTRKPSTRREVKYATYLRKTGNITDQPVNELNKYRLAYIQRKDNLIPDSVWSEIKSYSYGGNYRLTGLSKTYHSQFFNVWENFFPEYDGFVLIDTKSVNVLTKNVPNIVSYSQILYSYYNALNVKDKLYTDFYTHLRYQNAMLNNLKQQTKNIITEGLLMEVLDKDFKHLIMTFGSITPEKDSLYQMLSLNKSTNFPDDETLSPNIVNFAPFLLTPFGNAQHMVNYLNSVKFGDETHKTFIY